MATNTDEKPIVKVEMPKPSLASILNSIENFTGKENVKHFFERVEQRASLDNIGDEDLIKIVRCRLTGDAFSYYKSESNLSTNEITYKQFKQKFITKFSKLKIPGQAQLILSRCIQGRNETISQFLTRLKLIGQEVLEEDLIDASQAEREGIIKKHNNILLTQFRMGIKREISKIIGVLLMRESDLTLDKAAEIASQEELNQMMTENTINYCSHSYYSEYACNFSQEGVSKSQPHSTAPRVSFNKPNFKPQQFNKKNRPSISYHSSFSKPFESNSTKPDFKYNQKSNNVCYKCYQPGHFSGNCRNEVVCRFCKKTGHVEVKCWKKNNQSRGQAGTSNHTTRSHTQFNHQNGNIRNESRNPNETQNFIRTGTSHLNLNATSYVPQSEGKC